VFFLWGGLTLFSQQYFPKEIPAGNYSGICALGEDRYAVVSDKSATDGFFVFQIRLDETATRITTIRNEGFFSCGQANTDMEAICYCRPFNTVFIASEKTNTVGEYSLDGCATGRQLQMPAVFRKASDVCGIESLTYDAASRHFFLTTERPLPGDSLLRIQSFGLDLKPARQYLYKPDPPLSEKHFQGVSELCGMGDGRLLVLERQLLIPKLGLGARSDVRLYEVTLGGQDRLKKKLVTAFSTRLTVTNRSFANYEGLCLLDAHTLLMIADSQNQFRGVLRDWFKIIKL